MSGVIFGAMSIAVGILFLAFNFAMMRLFGAPFIDPRALGGYAGVIGVFFLGLGLLVLLASCILLIFGV